MKLIGRVLLGLVAIVMAPQTVAIGADCSTKYAEERTICQRCNIETADLVQDSSAPWESQAIYKRVECEKRLQAEYKLAAAERTRQYQENEAAARVEAAHAQEARIAKIREEDRLAAEATRAQQQADQQRFDRQEAERRQQSDVRQAQRAKECGSDLDSIKIGMTIIRAQRCVAPLKLVGQINRIDGVVVSSYQHCRGYSCLSASVIEGKIVAWNK